MVTGMEKADPICCCRKVSLVVLPFAGFRMDKRWDPGMKMMAEPLRREH